MNVHFKVNLKDQVALVTGGGGVCAAPWRVRWRLRRKNRRGGFEAGSGGSRGVGDSQGRRRGRRHRVHVLEKESRPQPRKGKTGTRPGGHSHQRRGRQSSQSTTSLEYLRKEDLSGPTRIDHVLRSRSKGIEFVFNLNFLGTLLPTQAFTREMAGKGKGHRHQHSSMNSFRPLTKIPAYSGAKAAVSNFTHGSRCISRRSASCQRHRARVFCHRPEPHVADQAGRFLDASRQHHPRAHADEPVRHARRFGRRAVVADLRRSVRLCDRGGDSD